MTNYLTWHVIVRVAAEPAEYAEAVLTAKAVNYTFVREILFAQRKRAKDTQISAHVARLTVKFFPICGLSLLFLERQREGRWLI